MFRFILSLVTIFSIVFSTNAHNINNDQLKDLVLREISGYCNHKTDKYTCMAYDYSEYSKDSVQHFINQNAHRIEKVTIENPSRIIYDLNFKELKQLKTLIIFGNDYDTDALTHLPKRLLKLKSLETIEFDGVRFPIKQQEKLKRKYKHLTIEGEIADVNY